MVRLTALLLVLMTASAAAFEVPVNNLAGWTSLAYRNIPANTVSIQGGELEIEVAGSASPLIYGLDEPLRVTGVSVVARWEGELRIPAGVAQGNEGADDFVMKIGVVEAGDQTLNWFQRRLAAGWIKQLFEMAPQGTGIRRVNFLSTTQQSGLLGISRVHPSNDLLFESRVTLLDGPGRFEMTQEFPAPVDSLGLWVSADGDDTDSAFVLRIERIVLHIET